MIKKIIFYFWILFISTICIYSIYLNNQNDKLYEIDVDSENVQMHSFVDESIYTVEKGYIEEKLNLTGIVKPIMEKEIVKNIISEPISKIDISVKVGDILDKGDVYAICDGQKYSAKAKWKCTDILDDGDATVFLFIDYSSLFVSVDVPIKSITNELLGREANLNIGEKVIVGKIDYIDAYCSEQKIETRIEYNNQKDLLFPGQELEVEFIGKVKEDTVIVPLDYVMYLPEYDEYSVYITYDGQSYYTSVIEPGIIGDEYVEIIAGVEQGEELLMPEYELSLYYYLLTGNNKDIE